MWLYTDTVTEHFQNPRNVGQNESARPAKERDRAKPAGQDAKSQSQHKPHAPSKPKQFYANPNATKPSKPAKRSGGTLSLKK